MRRMIKRTVYILLMMSMVLALSACGGESDEVSSAENDTETSESLYAEAVESDDEISMSDAQTEESGDGESDTSGEEGIDVDLTVLSSTMVYAEVYNMYMYPDEYIGDMVKMEGAFSVLEVEETGMRYFSVIIEDALGCCAQGIEFDLAGDYEYPGDYPEIGSTVTVIGEFETYEEYGVLYCRLKAATLY